MKTTCPFCTKTNLKGYPFTIDSLNDTVNKEPYDTHLQRVCGKCQKCPEMLKALDMNAYASLQEFCLSYVNGCGDFKSLKITFTESGAIIATSPNYRQTKIPPPYTIGAEESKQLKARIYIQHIELWKDFYESATSVPTYTWWNLSMTFADKNIIIKRGTDKLPQKWNRLIKVVGRYFEWLYKDWSVEKMYALKYNYKTSERELPTNTLPPFTDYWHLPLSIPPLVRFPNIDELKKGTRVCIYARTNQKGNAIQTQMKRCIDVCSQRELNVVAIFEDENISGIRDMGNGLKSLFEQAEKALFTHVVLTDISRYSRNTEKAWNIYADLKAKGIESVMIPPQKWGYWLNY